jgi:hypothetical protein
MSGVSFTLYQLYPSVIGLSHFHHLFIPLIIMLTHVCAVSNIFWRDVFLINLTLCFPKDEIFSTLRCL